MENMEVIAKVNEPTEWVSLLILVEKKNGKLIVCLDPRNLNQAIKRSRHPITHMIIYDQSYIVLPISLL